MYKDSLRSTPKTTNQNDSKLHIVYALLVAVVLCIVLIFATSLYTTEAFIPYSQLHYPVRMEFLSNYKTFENTGRKPLAKIINPHPFRYIKSRKGCNFTETNKPTLLILIKSAVSNFHLREAIRSTWGDVSRINVEIVFLLAFKAKEQNHVDTEAVLYGDIIQQDFRDAYMNNTYKTIMGFNWAVYYCHQANHIVFVDDDHYVNLPNLLSYIDTLDTRDNKDLMVGNVVKDAVPFRSPYSKWSVTTKQYPYDRWPPYLAGAVYLMSRDVVRKMAFAFPYVKSVDIDDAYLGIVASKIGIKLTHEPRLVIPPYVLYTDSSHMVYGEFKTLAEFQTVHRHLKRHLKMTMCVLTWKCQFAFLL
ncbi:beta-1,3-galactosyltransferase brn-like [Argopecten irradians]|uniref:beta-1,3-galactosyltransferase brn-like n=1 Tax=Argopecten irradians TaxID=31199 RepID=UPI003717F88A